MIDRSKKPLDEPVGLTEIAIRLGIDRDLLNVWHNRGKLPARRWTVGGRPAWKWRDIEEWKRKRTERQE